MRQLEEVWPAMNWGGVTSLVMVLAVGLPPLACGDRRSAGIAKEELGTSQPAPLHDAAALVATADAAPSINALQAQPEPVKPPGEELVAHAEMLFHVVACAGEPRAEMPVSEKFRTRHCKQLAKVIAEYRKRWLTKATPFFAAVIPDDIPSTIVYPFGGADLITALAVFPEFAELTSISLEPAGDARVPGKMKPAAPAPNPEAKAAPAPAPRPQPKPAAPAAKAAPAPAPKPQPKPAAPAAKPEPKPAAPVAKAPAKPEPKPA